MHTYLRNKPAWLQLLIFGGLTGGIIILVFTLGISIVGHIYNLSALQLASMHPSDYARPELVGVVRGLMIVQSIGFFLVPSMVFAYLADPNPIAYVGFKPPQKNWFLILALVTIFAAFFTVALMAMVNESLVHLLPGATQKWIENGESDANGVLENVLLLKNPTDLALAIILVGALPAIGEELFFRGILQKLFIQIFKSAWPGIVFAAFLFSAIHMQFMGFLPRMALGIILGALYWYSGSILTSMLGHFAFNSINVLLIYFKVSDLDSKSPSNMSYSLIGLASLALVVFLLNYLRKKSTTTYAGEFPPTAEITIFDEPDHPV